MNLPVAAAPPIVMSGILQGSNLMLNWSGGIAPYQVQQTTDLLNQAWLNLGAPTSATSVPIPTTNAAAFYRVSGQ
jgi:hypothetical protein